MNYAIRSVEYMSDEVRELLLSNNCTITSIVDIVTGLDETENLITITSDDYLESWDVEDFRYVPNVGLIGQFVQKKLSMTVKNGFDVSNLSNQIGFVSFVVNEAPKTEDGKTILYRVGMFIFDEVNKDDVKDKTTITGVDFTKIFEQKFDTIVDKISFPISAYNLAKAIVENCKFNFHGVDLNPISFDTSYTFNNSSFMIEKNPFVSGETCRDVLKYIGQLAGSWVRIGHNDNLGNEYVLIDFRKYQNGLQLKNVLTNDNYYDLELNNETFGAVNKIVMGLKDVDGENVSITDASTTNPNICEIALWDNPITYTEALRTKAINDLKFLFGFTYTPFTTNTTGYPWLQAYDKIKLVTMDNTEIITYPFNRTISYNGHIKTKIDTIGTTTTETKYTYESPVTRGLKQTQIMVDKANQKITSLVSTTEEIQDDINPIGTYKGVKHADLSGCIESELIWQNSYGDSQQLTRSGKNLFTKQGNATPKTDTTFWNNITHTTPESDGWCKVSVDNTNGTTTVFANQFTKRNTIDKLEVNKTYSILVEVRNLEMTRPSTSTTPAYLQLCETAKDSVWQGIQNYDLTIFKETNKVVFQKLTKTNFDSSLIDFRNFVSVPKGYKVEFEYRLMVVKGSYTLDTIGEYEPYGVMPSPDFPSPIESVGRKNLFDVDSITENAFLLAGTGETGSASTSNTSDYIFVKAGQPYYLSYSYTSLQSINYRSLCYYDTNKNFISSISIDPASFHTFTPAQDGYIRFAYDKNYTNIQLEKGTVASDYVPYEHTEISAEVTNANQWNNDLVINTTKSTDGFTMTDKWAVPLMTQSNVLNTFKPDTTYTIKVVSKVLSKPTTLSPNQSRYDILLYRSTPWSYFALNLYDKVNAKVGDINTTYTTITTPSDLHDFNLGGYCFFGNNDGSTTYKGSGSIEIQQIMLAEGEYTKDNFPDYVHYASNSLTIDLQGNELCSLPNGTKDEVNIINGEALLTKRIGKVVLDGSESWVKYQDYLYYYNESFILSPTTSYVVPNLISDNFTISTFNNLRNNPNIYMSANQLGSPNNQRGVSLYVNDYYSDVSTLKTWLSTHNVEVLYELAEPKTVNLGNVNLPTLYNDINHVDFTTYSDFYYNRDIPFNNIYVSKHDNDREIRTITEALAKQEITNNSITNSIQETNTTIARDYATKESVASDIQQTKNSLTIEFNEQIEDLQNKKVDTLKNQLVTIDVNGIEVSTNLSTVSTIMRNDRFAIKSGDTEAFYVGYDENLKKSVSRMNDLTITDYFTAGYHRQEKFEINGEQRTGWFYVGGE